MPKFPGLADVICVTDRFLAHLPIQIRDLIYITLRPLVTFARAKSEDTVERAEFDNACAKHDDAYCNQRVLLPAPTACGGVRTDKGQAPERQLK